MYSSTRSLIVNDIMSYPVVTAKESDSIRTLSKKMQKFDINTIVIVNKSDVPIGIVTEGDIVKKLLSRKRHVLFNKAKHAMSRPIIIISKEAKLEDAAKLMVSKGIKRLCVVDGQARLIGIVSQSDIIKNASYLIDVLNEIIQTNTKPDEEIVKIF